MANNLRNSLAPALRTPLINNSQQGTISKAFFLGKTASEELYYSVLCRARFKTIDGTLTPCRGF